MKPIAIIALLFLLMIVNILLARYIAKKYSIKNTLFFNTYSTMWKIILCTSLLGCIIFGFIVNNYSIYFFCYFLLQFFDRIIFIYQKENKISHSSD